MDTDKKFGRRLAAVISTKVKDSGRTQREMAQATGLTLAVLNGRLNGHVDLKVTELHDIADALGITASSLMNEAA